MASDVIVPADFDPPTTSPGEPASLHRPRSSLDEVIGCVYVYPLHSEDWDVTVQSWVRADRASLDVPLADAVARWLATDWPWERVDRCGR
jgi:hypothetical protein